MKLRVAVAGLVHDHIWKELPHWAGHEKANLIAVSDPNPPLRDRLKKEYGVEKEFNNAIEMLDVCQPDIVQIGSSTKEATLIAIAAAERKIDAILEKPLAVTLKDADRMIDACRKNRTRLLVNWPLWWRPQFLEAISQFQQGTIGQLYLAKMRMAHNGPKEVGCSPYFCEWLYSKENGGGAHFDYNCYGAVTFRYLFGEPKKMNAFIAKLTKKDTPCEDESLIVMQYDHLMTQSEGSWNHVPATQEATFFGTKGILHTNKKGCWLTNELGVTTELTPKPNPKGLLNGPDYLLSCIENDNPIEGVFSPEVSREGLEIIEKTYRLATKQSSNDLSML